MPCSEKRGPFDVRAEWSSLDKGVVAIGFECRNPPGNRFEALKGDRSGQFSIRINDQWRICFEWSDDDGPYNIEIVDYH